MSVLINNEELRANDKHGNRWYKTGSVWVPSVTTVLDVFPKPELYRWYGNHASYESAIAERNAAGERGTMIHEAIESLIAGETVSLIGWEDRCIKQLQGFINWWHEAQPEVIATEEFVYGDGYAGQIDLVARINGDVWIVDFKSSASIYPSHHIQTAAYRAAWNGTHDVQVEGRGVLHLKSNTKKGWQMVGPEDYVADVDAFWNCLELFHYIYGYEPTFDEREPLPEEVVL